MNKGLFLDRDGVINVDRGYVYRIEEFQFVDGIFALCSAFLKCGYQIFVITNQSGIARGYYTKEDYDILTSWMLGEFRKMQIEIIDIYACPYHPDGIVAEYRKESRDRKPNPGMILKAAEKYNVDLGQSVLIGDRESDIQAGEAAGIRHCFYFTRDTKIQTTYPVFSSHYEMVQFMREMKTL